MILNNETAAKVAALINYEYSTVTYNGCCGNNCICFTLHSNDANNEICEGIAIYITEDFKIVRKEAMKRGYMDNDRQVRWHKVPFISPNKIPAQVK